MAKQIVVTMQDLYALKWRAIWAQFRSEHFSFWMICGYLFIEYVRPQSIIRELDILPWGKLFIILSLFGVLADRNKKWVRDPANKWMFLFLFVITISSFFAYFPDWSWKYWMDLFNWVLIYFLIINIVRTQKRFFIFLLIFLLSCFKISFGVAKNWALRGFSFADWGLTGPSGPFQNSGELSILMLSFGPVALELARFIGPYASKMAHRIVLLMPVSAAMVVVGASSRGSQIGLVVQIYHAFLKGRVTLRSVVVVVLVGCAGYLLLPEEQKQRFETAGDDKTSQQRLYYWKHGVDMIKDNPILGVGFFNFIPYYKTHYIYDMLSADVELPHNIFIQVGTDAGFCGLFVYLMLIRRTFKASKEIRALEYLPDKGFYGAVSKGLDAGMWGFLIAGQFVTVAYYPFMWINLSLVVALKNIGMQESRDNRPASR